MASSSNTPPAPIPTLPPGSKATPPAKPGVNYIPQPNWTLFRSLPTFDLRNGGPEDVSSVFIKATIPTPYHWVPISDLAPVDAVQSVDGFIKSHLAYLGVNPPPALNAAQVRKAAICLGTARAVSTTFYRITNSDIIPGELAAPMLTASKMADGSTVFEPMPDLPAETTALLQDQLVLTEEEKAVVCALVKCATGLIPMQGYSLMMTNHHYLSQADSQSRKVYAVVERAYWKSVDVAGWFGTDTQMIQDFLWHKACHPVFTTVKNNAAMDITLPGKLAIAGAGACASRLPAVETELRSANSFMTLLATVSPMFEICQGSLSFELLSDVVEAVKSLPPGVPNPTIKASFPKTVEGKFTNRTDGLVYLGNMLKRNQDSVAYCYGFYCALSDNNMVSGQAGATDTLKTSYSLSKLKSQSFASYTSGYQVYGDYQAVRNAQRARGEFIAPEMTIS